MSQLSASHVSQRSRSERSRSSSRGSRHSGQSSRKRDRASTYHNGSRSNPPRSGIRIKSKILYSGSAMKQSLTNPEVWKKRYFVLFENRRLVYWRNEEDFQDARRAISSIDLKHATSIQPVDFHIPSELPPEKPKKSGWFGFGADNPTISTSQSSGANVIHSHGSNDFAVDRSQSDYTGMLHHNAYGAPNGHNLHDDTPVPGGPDGSNSLKISFISLMTKKQNKPRSERPNMSMSNGSRDNTEEDSRSAMSNSNISHSESEQIRYRPDFGFEIVTPSRSYILCTFDEYHRVQWLEHLRSVTFGNKIFSGWLEKLKVGARNKSVKKRWFVIYDTREIRYYETERALDEKGCITLDQLQIMNLLEDKEAKSQYRRKNVFELVCGGRKWVLVAESPEMRELWFERVVQVVPNVQRLDPLYSNELSYKRNDRAKKWIKGYFAMDVEYLFFFKTKASFDAFKSSAYFSEDLYTLALSQHVQGLIPLRNRKIKELDRNHPACSGKNKFVFSLKTSQGEFFLSTQYSIQMDDWLDAFRELYRFEVREKRAGVISKRRKHSNSFGRRPPSPPSRQSRSTSSHNAQHRSISPHPSETQHHFASANLDEEPSRSRDSRSQSHYRPPPPPRVPRPFQPDPSAGIHSANLSKNGINGIQQARAFRSMSAGGTGTRPPSFKPRPPRPIDTSLSGQHDIAPNGSNGGYNGPPPRNPNLSPSPYSGSYSEGLRSPSETPLSASPHERGRSRRRRPKPKPPSRSSRSPPGGPSRGISSSPPNSRPGSRAGSTPSTPHKYLRRTNTPFDEIEVKMRGRRKSMEFANEAHYTITSKHIQQERSRSPGIRKTSTLQEADDEDKDSNDSVSDEPRRAKPKMKPKSSKSKSKSKKPKVDQIAISKSSPKSSKSLSQSPRRRRKGHQSQNSKESKRSPKSSKSQKSPKSSKSPSTKQLKSDASNSASKSPRKSPRSRRRDKPRKQSVGQVLKSKISSMLSDSKKKDEQKRLRRQRSREKKAKLAAKRKKEAELKRKKEKEKEQKEKEKEFKRKQAKQQKQREKPKFDVMVSLDELERAKTDHQKSLRKKREDKNRRKSVGAVLREALSSKPKDVPSKVGDGKESRNGRKKRMEKERRKSAGEALKAEAKRRRAENNGSGSGSMSISVSGSGLNEGFNNSNDSLHSLDSNGIPRADSLQSSLSVPGTNDDDKNGNGNRNGRKKRGDKSRRKSYNAFLRSSNSESDELEDDSKSKSGRKSRKDKSRRSSTPLGAFFGSMLRSRSRDPPPEEDDDEDSNEDDNVEEESPTESPRKDHKDPSPRNKQEELSDIKKRINSKTKRKHGHQDTPLYDSQSKEMLRQQFTKSKSVGDDDVATDELPEDKETEKYESKRGQRNLVNRKSKRDESESDSDSDSDDSRDSTDEVKPKKVKKERPEPIQTGNRSTKRDKERDRDRRRNDRHDRHHRDRDRDRDRDRHHKRRMDDHAQSRGSNSSDSRYSMDRSDSEDEYMSSESEYETTDSDEYTESDSEETGTTDTGSYTEEEYETETETVTDSERTPTYSRSDSEDSEEENGTTHKSKHLKVRTDRQQKAIQRRKEKQDAKRAAIRRQKEEEEAVKEKEKQREKENAERKESLQEMKEKQQQLERERKQRQKEQEMREKQRREEREKEDGLEYEDEEEDEYEDDYYEDDESDMDSDEDSEDEDSDDDETGSGDTDSHELEEDESDSLSSNSDDMDEEDAAMKAYVQLNSNDTAALMEGDEHREWEIAEAKRMLHRRQSTELWRHTQQQIIADENDEAVADEKELSRMWIKLQSIPQKSSKDTTETRIVKEFMMFQLNHDHSIDDSYILIENMDYPNIYVWNAVFVGPMGTPYVNGKYRILLQFPRDYPLHPPKIVFLTKIYNSSVKHNKKKKRGLLKLPKFFETIWSQNISLRQWLNVVYEFVFYYCGDHFFDPMNQRVAREFIFAFDSFIDTCYQWNLIFADGYSRERQMIELHDEYGERQKLTFHCAKFSNQYDLKQYAEMKEAIWSTLRDTYHATYQSFVVLLEYFGSEFYYCGLSELIREPHVCVRHKVKRFDNIVNW